MGCLFWSVAVGFVCFCVGGIFPQPKWKWLQNMTEWFRKGEV